MHAVSMKNRFCSRGQVSHLDRHLFDMFEPGQVTKNGQGRILLIVFILMMCVVVQWCDPLTLQPEQSGGVG